MSDDLNVDERTAYTRVRRECLWEETYRADFVHINDDGGARAWTTFLRGNELFVLPCPELMYSA